MAVAAAIGIFIYISFEAKKPSEQTAKFLPEETVVYFSMNLRPGLGQLTKFMEIIRRFEENASFGDRSDEALEDIEDETDLALREELCSYGWGRSWR